MKKTLYLLFALFSAVSITNIYASCYDVSSCRRELDDEENRRNSTQMCTSVLKSQNPISDSYDVCDYIYGTLALSSMSNFGSSGWDQVYENCYGSVWCHDRPTFSSSSSSSKNSSYSSLDISDSSFESPYSDIDVDMDYSDYSLPSSYSGGSSYRYSYKGDCDVKYDIKNHCLCFEGFGKLREKTHDYEKEVIINDSRIKYWGKITYGKPTEVGVLYYYDSELGPIAIFAGWKHGRPDEVGIIFSKYGSLAGKWDYGDFDSKLFTNESSLVKTLTLLERTAKIKFKDESLTENLSTKIIDANSELGKKLLKSFERERSVHIVSEY